MTPGSKLPLTTREWHQRVWRLAGPIIISNMSIPLVGAVDTAVVGHLPDPVYIGAVALGAIIFSFIFWCLSFLRMGTTGFIAQAHGAGDSIEIRSHLLRALLLAALLSLFVIVAQQPIGAVAFWFMNPGPELETLARDYFGIRIWAAPAVLANYVILGCLIGLHNTRTALILQLLLNGINVILDLVFVMAWQWDVPGVALASLISEYVAALTGLYLLFSSLKPVSRGWTIRQLLSPDRIRVLFQVNRDIFIRTFSLTLAWFYFTTQSTRLGEITLAANAVLLHFQHIMAFGLDGFAFAVEALAGSACGARDRHALRTAVKITSLWALIIAGIYSLVYAILGPLIISAITSIEAVQTTALLYLPWVIVSPLISVWSFQLDGIFIGTTRTAEMRNAMLLSVFVYLLAVLLLVPVLANHGLWLSLFILMICRALTLAWYYPRIERNLPVRVE